MRYRYLLYILFFLFFLSCENGVDSIKIPLEHNRDKMITIPLTLRDTTLSLIFDTGSGMSSIKKSLSVHGIEKEKTGRKIKFTWQLLGISEECDIIKPQIVFINDLKIPKKISFQLTDVVSIIGNDIIDQFYWKFDFKKDSVTISKKPIIIDEANYSKLEYSLISPDNFKVLDIHINDTIVLKNIFIDMGHRDVYNFGANGKEVILHLFSDDEKEHECINEKFIRQPNINVVYTMKKDSSDYKCKLYPFDSLKIENNTLAKCNISFEYEKKIIINGIQANGLLTLDFFKHFEEVYIDTKGKTIYLKPYDI